jgi:PAS domain S-box-containing protein
MSQPLKVLLVEDSPLDQKLILEQIRQGNVSFTHLVLDAAEALSAQLQLADWDVVITDYNLPGANGLDVLRQVKASGKDIPVIVVSGSIGEETAVVAMQAGADDYLMKDNLTRLVPAIDRAISQAQSRRERRHTELSLQEVKLRLEGIIASAMDAIITINAGQRIVMANPAAEKMFGYPAAQLMNEPLSRLLPGRFAAAHGGHIGQFGQSGKTTRQMGVNMTLYGQRADGTEFPLEASISQVQVGGQQYFTAILRDVTRRQESENKLRQQAQLLELIDEGVISLTPDRRVRSWSRGAETIFGIAAAGAIGKPLSDLLSIRYYGTSGADSTFEQVLERQTWKGEVVILTQTGGTHPVFLTISRFTGQGEGDGYILVCKDIQEISSIQHQLIRQQSYILSTIENSADAIFALNDRYELLYYNTTYKNGFREFGIDVNIGDDLRRISSPRGEAQMRENWERVQRGEKFTYPYDYTLPGGDTRFFDVSVHPIYGPDGAVTGISYLYRDVTEKKRLDEEMRRIGTELHQAQLKEQWIQSAALLEGQEGERKRLARELHDGLGQMLNALKLQLARENVTGNYRQTLDEIIGEVKRMNNNLMPLVLEDFGLEAGIRQLVEKYQLTTAAELYFFCDVKERRFASAFEVGVYRIVQEAVSNAVKYAGATHISVQVTHNEQSLLVMVEDDGKGFDPEAVRHTGPGGYGLLNLKFRAEALGGKLEISSQAGHGCVVTAELPLPAASPYSLLS